MPATVDQPGSVVQITASRQDDQAGVRVRSVDDAFDRTVLKPDGGILRGDGSSAPAPQPTVRGTYTRPSPGLFETFPRLGTSIAERTPLASGTLELSAIELPEGVSLTGLSFVAGAVPAGTPTHWWYVLADSALSVLAKTADQTTAAYAAATDHPVAFTAPYTTTYSGLYYVGIMFVATTPPSLHGVGQADVNGIVPILAGASSTGQTTPPALGATLTAITAGGTQLYSYVY